jgi:hypothetical protein
MRYLILLLLSSLVGCANRYSEECFIRQESLGMSLWYQGSGGTKILGTTALNQHVTSEGYGIVVSTSTSYTGGLRFESWPQTAVPDGDFVVFLSFSRIIMITLEYLYYLLLDYDSVYSGK